MSRNPFSQHSSMNSNQSTTQVPHPQNQDGLSGIEESKALDNLEAPNSKIFSKKVQTPINLSADSNKFAKTQETQLKTSLSRDYQYQKDGGGNRHFRKFFEESKVEEDETFKKDGSNSAFANQPNFTLTNSANSDAKTSHSFFSNKQFDFSRSNFKSGESIQGPKVSQFGAEQSQLNKLTSIQDRDSQNSDASDSSSVQEILQIPDFKKVVIPKQLIQLQQQPANPKKPEIIDLTVDDNEVSPRKNISTSSHTREVNSLIDSSQIEVIKNQTIKELQKRVEQMNVLNENTFDENLEGSQDMLTDQQISNSDQRNRFAINNNLRPKDKAQDQLMKPLQLQLGLKRRFQQQQQDSSSLLESLNQSRLRGAPGIIAPLKRKKTLFARDANGWYNKPQSFDLYDDREILFEPRTPEDSVDVAVMETQQDDDVDSDDDIVNGAKQSCISDLCQAINMAQPSDNKYLLHQKAFRNKHFIDTIQNVKFAIFLPSLNNHMIAMRLKFPSYFDKIEKTRETVQTGSLNSFLPNQDLEKRIRERPRRF
eukprot:403363888